MSLFCEDKLWREVVQLHNNARHMPIFTCKLVETSNPRSRKWVYSNLATLWCRIDKKPAYIGIPHTIGKLYSLDVVYQLSGGWGWLWSNWMHARNAENYAHCIDNQREEKELLLGNNFLHPIFFSKSVHFVQRWKISIPHTSSREEKFHKRIYHQTSKNLLFHPTWKSRSTKAWFKLPAMDTFKDSSLPR